MRLTTGHWEFDFYCFALYVVSLYLALRRLFLAWDRFKHPTPIHYGFPFGSSHSTPRPNTRKPV
jgi:hypothetical protein